MVALAVVLEHQLPVGLLLDGGGHGHLEVGHVVEAQVAVEDGLEVAHVRRILGEADEQVAAGLGQRDRGESVVLESKVLAHLGAGEQQASVQLVGPLMVGAHQLGQLALFGGAQARSAMAAGVVEGVNGVAIAAHDDHRIMADVEGDEVALGGNLAAHAGEDPLALEDGLHVELEQSFIVVERLRQREAEGVM